MAKSIKFFLDNRTFFALVFVLCVQALFQYQAWNRLYFEEFSESIRNPYWVSHGTVYDGLSTLMGWYYVQIFFYKVFGFDIHAAKIIRFLISALGLWASASLLVRYLGRGQAFVPLMLFGLSPTLLYLTTYQTSYGIDLSLFPVLIWVLERAFHSKKLTRVGFIFLSGFFGMWASYTYPTFLLYLPAIYFYFLWRASRAENFNILKAHLPLVLGFALPFVLTLIHLENWQVFLNDTRTGSGVFRGGGSLHLHIAVFLKSLSVVIGDLFIHGNSYYFQIPGVEFGGFGPWVTWALVVASVLILAAYIAYRFPEARVPILLCFLLILLNLVVSNLTHRVPGLRRTTGALVGFYVLMSFVWAYRNRLPNFRKFPIAVILFSCLLLHHLEVVPKNLRYVRENARIEDYFLSTAPDPDIALDKIASGLREGIPLSCEGRSPCRLTEIYALLSIEREWLEEDVPPISAITPELGLVTLQRSLWNEWKLRH